MKKIALVGAPNSGKSELARQIADIYPDQKVSIVDGYIEEIEKRSDNTLSHFGSYLGNVQAAIGRWESERRIIRDDKPDILIICGTMIETVVYNGIHALVENNVDGNELTLRALQNDKRASVSMTFLGIVNNDTWDYDFAFYLPLSEEFKAKEGNKWATSVDEHIPESAEALGAILEVLPTQEDNRLAMVLQHITENETDSPVE